jgi:hypothetical protein
MNRILGGVRVAAAVAGVLLAAVGAASAQDAASATGEALPPSPPAAVVPPQGGYEVHDARRPQPPVVAPGTFSTQAQPGKPPGDAVVLFDGRDLSKWKSAKGGGEAKWKVENGELVVAPRTGPIATKEEFADVQLHAEWMEPTGITGRSQGRGNSGIFLMGLYELQVLDSHDSETYADGMAGSIYGQYPPLVNATRPQGEWQVYDVVFHPPVYEGGKVVQPATETVFLNGVLVQDHTQLIGPTKHQQLTEYPTEHPAKGPIQLQDHRNPIRFRNIWVRPTPKASEHPVPPTKSAGENYYEKAHGHGH